MTTFLFAWSWLAVCSTDTKPQTDKFLQSPPPRVTLTKQSLHALYAASTKHWSAKESEAFVRIVLRESSGNTYCTTSRSSSAGLFGFIRSTMRSHGVTLRSPLVEQARAFESYCTRRYGSISGAWKHHLSRFWY